ncbi:hypothetical protein [Flavimaricola marinus]|nr:hypothetical protein [Flavimaricola marinus]
MTACLRNPSRDRPGWSAKFLRCRPESVLYIKPQQPNWYRRPDLFDWIEAEHALFSGFDRVVLMGGSMGGYGALAFARAMRATEVLSLNPQTTLARDLVPWETRFALGRAEDWTGRYRDAAETTQGDVYVIADRYEKNDFMQVDRLRGHHFANFPFVGHKVPAWLQQLDALKPVSLAVLDGLPPAEVQATIHGAIRQRRKLERWWAGVANIAGKHGKRDLLARFVTPEAIEAAIPMKPDSAMLRRLQADLYRLVAQNQQHAPEKAAYWQERAAVTEAEV